MTRADHVIALLHESAGWRDPNPGRDHIAGQLHALRCGGILQALHGDEPGFVGLVHDLGRPLNDVHHGEVIAEIVRDRVSETAYAVLRDHGAMQAAVVHGRDLPPHGWLDEALCAAELRSFEVGYTGPAYDLADARRIIQRWLG